MNKRKKFSFVEVIALVACAAVLILSATYTATTVYVGERSKNDYSEVQEEVMRDVTVEDGISKKEKKKIKEGLAELMAQNPDVKGWITIEGTHVDYPIMQHITEKTGSEDDTEDYEYYLHRDMNGKYSYPGSIFLDNRHSINDPAFHCLYGHHMKNSTMFRDIARYLKADYFDAHKNIWIFTDKKTMQLEPVYCFHSRQDPDFRSVIYSHTEAGNFLSLKTGEDLPDGNYFILITCSYFTNNERTYLVCREKE